MEIDKNDNSLGSVVFLVTWSKRDLDHGIKAELEVNCSQPAGHIESDSKGLAARTSVHLQPRTATLKTHKP
jgi:hypothetical protein